MRTIAEVVDNGLCMGCGTCVGVCPKDAIEIRRRDHDRVFLPQIERDRCIKCGLCVKTCPGYSVDFEDLNQRIFGKQPDDPYLGNYSRCYVGHSNDQDILHNSASGGLLSHLLIYALENDIIDAALVTRMRKDRPLESEATIASTREEILAASRSKYCPVATNGLLKHIQRTSKRYAVVGLPCHIHGIRKAEETLPRLKERIVLHAGLLCSHAVNFDGTELILDKVGVRKEDVSELSYRGRGWPGHMSIRTRDGADRLIPLMGGWQGYWSIFSSFFFTPMRCLMCPDQANELADISFGDAWLPELMRHRIGTSVVVTRTKLSEKILEQMRSEKIVSLDMVQPAKVKQSQAPNLRFKKDDYESRLKLLRALGKQTPNHELSHNMTGSPFGLVKGFYPYLGVRASSSRLFQPVLTHLPFPLFRMYSALYRIPSISQQNVG